jgi:hypothetical protein
MHTSTFSATSNALPWITVALPSASVSFGPLGSLNPRRISQWSMRRYVPPVAESAPYGLGTSKVVAVRPCVVEGITVMSMASEKPLQSQ